MRPTRVDAIIGIGFYVERGEEVWTIYYEMDAWFFSQNTRGDNDGKSSFFFLCGECLPHTNWVDKSKLAFLPTF